MSKPPSPESVAAANVEITKRALDAFNRRDVDTMLELATDDFEIDWSRSLGPMRGVYKGPDAFRYWLDDQWSMFEVFEVEPEEITPCGDQHVLVTTTVNARGRGGVPVSARSSHLYAFDEGRLARVTLYQGREEALAATART